MENVSLAFCLTAFAGLSTGIGSALAFFTRRTSTKTLSFALGFSAGVMSYVSFIEIFPKARDVLTPSLGEPRAYWLTSAAFLGGMILIALIDWLVPEPDNPHEIRMLEDYSPSCPAPPQTGLLRMGSFAALAIGIHNFPEGMATFAAALYDPKLGFSIAIAIAIHNIPEGIAVSFPVYFATGSRKKAFCLSFLSGISEPIGALIGYLFLLRFSGEQFLGIIFAGVAGIMVFISMDELLPAAQKYDQHHLSVYGLICGMATMALSLVLLAE